MDRVSQKTEGIATANKELMYHATTKKAVTYCKKGGNQLTKANVSLLSPYIGPPLMTSPEFFL